MSIDAPTDTPSRPWWLDPPAETAGLSGAEAEAQPARFGPNVFRERQEKSLLLQYLRRFKNPLLIILLVASAVSAFIGEIAGLCAHYEEAVAQGC